MPELAEVETLRQRIDRPLAGAKVIAFESFWKRQLRPDFQKFSRLVIGRTITGTARRGKRLLLLLDDGQVIGVQLGMSGNLVWQKQEPAAHKHLRANFRLDHGWLLFYDARKFGRLLLFPDPQQALAGLGPDALEAAARAGELAAQAKKRKKAIKTLLLDQSFLAGVGNIYADEALFRARIHPARLAAEIKQERLEQLFLSLTRVLQEAVANGGTSFDWVWSGGRMQQRLLAYGRAGQECSCCGSKIRRLRLLGRSAHFCPKCQK